MKHWNWHGDSLILFPLSYNLLSSTHRSRDVALAKPSHYVLWQTNWSSMDFWFIVQKITHSVKIAALTIGRLLRLQRRFAWRLWRLAISSSKFQTDQTNGCRCASYANCIKLQKIERKKNNSFSEDMHSELKMTFERKNWEKSNEFTNLSAILSDFSTAKYTACSTINKA